MAGISVIWALIFCASNCPAQASPHQLGEARCHTEGQQSCLSLPHPAPQVHAVHSFLDLTFSVRDQHKANQIPFLLSLGEINLILSDSHKLQVHTHLTPFLHLSQFST